MLQAGRREDSLTGESAGVNNDVNIGRIEFSCSGFGVPRADRVSG